MNNALYAIPGLMPPTNPHFVSKIVTPEDGSLSMCVHCGRTGDEVFYTLYLHGWGQGAVKDPSYQFGLPCGWVPSDHDRWPQFMTVSQNLPPDAIVPYKVVRDIPIPITERPDIPDEDKLYWIINLPKRMLPIGDSKVQVSVNNKVHTWYIQRPAFDIHSPMGITSRYWKLSHQSGEDLDVAFEENTAGVIELDLSTCCGNPAQYPDVTYRASMTFGATTTQLTTQINDNDLSIFVPPSQLGYGTWLAEYKLFDDWLQLAAGDIIIVPANQPAQ